MGYTTIEQSKKLLEIGLSPDTADMCYYMQYHREIDGGGKSLTDTPVIAKAIGEDVPCWSMEALLEAMPQYVRAWDYNCWKNYDLNLFRSYYHCCSYSFGPSLKKENHDTLKCYGGDTWMEAVYNIAVWALENVENNRLKQNAKV